LRHLDAWNEQRRVAARRYDELLSEKPGVRLPATLPGNDHVWHLYVVRMPRRDDALARLHASGIGAGIHYPVTLNLTGAFAQFAPGRGAFPVAETIAAEILSLPLFPGITAEQQAKVADVLARTL
jgi:dTDP-4-amino-4,6-dideoxygalactose transaminase